MFHYVLKGEKSCEDHTKDYIQLDYIYFHFFYFTFNRKHHYIITSYVSCDGTNTNTPELKQSGHPGSGAAENSSR